MSHPHPHAPRALLRAGLLGLVVAMVLAIALALAAPSAVAAERPARRVVIVLATEVDWTRVNAQDTPTLDFLLRRSTLANLVAKRQLGEGARITVPSQAAMTLSAGAWTAPAFGARPAYDASETIDGRPVLLEFERLYRTPPGGADVLYLGHDFAQRAQDDASLGAELGALADAFQRARGGVFALGNSDWGPRLRRSLDRPAGVAAADPRAKVPWGRVGASLLATDDAAPYGIRTDADRLAEAYDEASRDAAGRPGPTLAVLDAGDTFRLVRAQRSTTEPDPEWRAIALADLEQTVALGSNGLTPDDLLMVVSIPTYGSKAAPQGFGTVLLYGREFSAGPGFASSSSTRRDALVTMPDLSATAVAAAGLPLPCDVHRLSGRPRGGDGHPGRAPGGAGPHGPIRAGRPWRQVLRPHLLHAGHRSGRSPDPRGRVAHKPRAARPPSRVGVLRRHPAPARVRARGDVARVRVRPSAAARARPAGYAGDGPRLAIWLLALLVRWFLPRRIAFGFVSIGTALVIAVDQWLGAPLSFSTSLGYSPLEAARFYGLGNEPAAIMLSSGLLGVALVADQMGGYRGRRMASWGIPLFGGALVLTAVLPMAGANIGVAVWGTVAVVLATRLASGGRLSWRVVLLAFALAAAVTLGAAWVDSLASSQTHVARAIASAESGGIAALGTIVVRKAAASFAYLRATPWILLFVVIYGWLLWGAFRPSGPHRVVADADPSYFGAMKAIVIAGLVAYVSEDSGIVMPIALSNMVLLSFAYVALAAARTRDETAEERA